MHALKVVFSVKQFLAPHNLGPIKNSTDMDQWLIQESHTIAISQRIWPDTWKARGEASDVPAVCEGGYITSLEAVQLHV